MRRCLAAVVGLAVLYSAAAWQVVRDTDAHSALVHTNTDRHLMPTSPHLLAQMDSITDAENPEQLARLEKVLTGLSPGDCEEAEFRALLAVLERFPLSDGFESFWSIVHFLEACEGYEPFLVESVRRQPAELTLTMLNRLLNAGFTHCGETSYVSLLELAAANGAAAPELRALAAHFAQYQARSRSDA